MEQGAPSLLPPRPTRGLEMLEENNISNALVVTLHKVRARGSLRLHPLLPLTGTTAAKTLSPGQTITLRPPPPRERVRPVCLLPDKPARLLRSTETLTPECHHRATP